MTSALYACGYWWASDGFVTERMSGRGDLDERPDGARHLAAILALRHESAPEPHLAALVGPSEVFLVGATALPRGQMLDLCVRYPNAVWHDFMGHPEAGGLLVLDDEPVAHVCAVSWNKARDQRRFNSLCWLHVRRRSRPWRRQPPVPVLPPRPEAGETYHTHETRLHGGTHGEDQ